MKKIKNWNYSMMVLILKNEDVSKWIQYRGISPPDSINNCRKSDRTVRETTYQIFTNL